MSKSHKELITQDDPNNDLIVHHNHLIEARYNLSLQEKRLMCWLASQVKQSDEDFKEHELCIKEFAKLVDIKGDHLYKTLDVITHKLMQKIITIRSLTKKGFTKAALLGGVQYYEGQGTIKLSFHPYLKPYMLQLKERFTKIRLGDIMGLRSVHAMRLYELTKQYEAIGERKILLAELRECCGVTDNQYKKFNDFKKDVLERSKKEINAKTDLLIEYEEIKTSRKVTAIKFTVKKNPNYGLTEFEKVQQVKSHVMTKEMRSDSVLIQQLMEYGFSRSIAYKLIKKGTHEEISDAIKAVDLQVSKGLVKNAKAMIQSAIDQKWKPDAYRKKKSA